MEQGDIALEGDKIVAIGRHIPSGGDLSMDLAGKWIMPGIVDAHSHIGLINDGTGRDGEDVNEMTCPNTAHLRAIDGINPFDHCFVEAYEHGVTSVVTGPGSANVIAGQFAALKTYGRCVEEMVIREPVAVKVAFGENPKNVYGPDKKAPSTRMATAGILREALLSPRSTAASAGTGREQAAGEGPPQGGAAAGAGGKSAPQGPCPPGGRHFDRSAHCQGVWLRYYPGPLHRGVFDRRPA